MNLMSAAEEKQKILDLLEEVCELAERGELGFEYKKFLVAEGDEWRSYDGGLVHPSYEKEGWSESRMMVCPAIAPGLRIELGVFLCGLWHDHYREKSWIESLHDTLPAGKGECWRKDYLSKLRAIPIGLRYRLNRALRPLVAHIVCEEARVRNDGYKKAAYENRVGRERAILKSMKGQADD